MLLLVEQVGQLIRLDLGWRGRALCRLPQTLDCTCCSNLGRSGKNFAHFMHWNGIILVVGRGGGLVSLGLRSVGLYLGAVSWRASSSECLVSSWVSVVVSEHALPSSLAHYCISSSDASVGGIVQLSTMSGLSSWLSVLSGSEGSESLSFWGVSPSELLSSSSAIQ